MNRLAIVALVLLAGLGLAFQAHTEPAQADGIVAQTLRSDGSTNTWTQADLVAALQLLNRKYHRDCERPDGRKAWHGSLVYERVDTNTLTKVERYADGTEFTYPAKIVTPAAAAKAYMARLAKRQLTTNGVPAVLAAARQRIGNTAVSNVTVRIKAGK